MYQLTAEKRDKIGKAVRGLRKEGKLPAIFYGPKETTTPIAVSAKEFGKVWHEAGESAVIELSGVDETKEVLIHEVDVDPVTGAPRHADFYVIEKGKKVTVSVPLEFIGVSPAVKDLGGILVKVLHEIEIEVMPKDLPHDIRIDISTLVNFESQIKIKDLKLPESAEVLDDLEEVVALVSEAKEEEELPVEEPDLDSIEVEKKGKTDEEAGEEMPSGEEKKE
ncbi:MAG TPA: 50S ribosomal protein L25 [Candidatus Paceibacterota bacterium]|jgi:large subunit ribosomal protein L25